MGAIELYENSKIIEIPCNGCKYLFNPKENLFICKKKDKFILAKYPPKGCETRE